MGGGGIHRLKDGFPVRRPRWVAVSSKTAYRMCVKDQSLDVSP